MRLFRIVRAQFANDMSGEGSRLYGGRWSPSGVPALYTSGSIALAALEVLVHAPRGLIMPDIFRLVTIDVPDKYTIATVDPASLPEHWDKHPAPKQLEDLGRKWAQQGEALVLKVPSAVIGGSEFNYLLNPLHPNYSVVTIAANTPFTFDSRLSK